MKTDQLKNVANDMFNENIQIFLQTVPGKWYECKYQKYEGEINLNTVYGISVDGSNMIDFDFKTGKTEDAILKTFVTQFINKWVCNQFVFKNGQLCKPDKKEIIAKLKNSDRVTKFYFYTTLYGIGYFCLFMNKSSFDKINKKLGDYLISKNISFKNEFSEAGWVYRFVINKPVDIHNKLLNDFEL